MRRLLLIISYLLLLTLSAKTQQPAPMTLSQAREWCDTTTVTGLTGIYLWPDRGALVLIRPAATHSYTDHYRVESIEHPDIRIAPGTLLAELTPTAAGTDYTLSEYVRPGHSTRTRKHTAKADIRNGELHLSDSKLNISFRPLSLLPGLRSLITLRRDNPASSQLHGLTRIYPLRPQGRKEGILWPKYF